MAGMTGEEGSKRVHVVVSMKIRPGAEGRMLVAFAPVAEATRKEEACIRYELFRGMEDANRFVLVEEWRDQAGLDAHLQLPHVKGLLAAMPEVLAEPLTIKTLAAKE
jgi:quinol monooxygenase YgiN